MIGQISSTGFEILPLLLSSFIGGVLAIMGDAVLNWRRRRIERNRLRRALLTEIERMDKALKKVKDTSENTTIDQEFFPLWFYPDPNAALPTSLYHENMDALRMLSASEIEKIVEFYTNIRGVRSGLPADMDELLTPRTVALTETSIEQREDIARELKRRMAPVWKQAVRCVFDRSS